MLAFFCLGARYRPWRYSAAVRSRVFGDGAAPRRTPAARPSRARTLSFVLLMRETFSKSCLRRRFYAGRAAVIWCGANPGVRPWQDLRECVLGRLAVAIYSRGAFPSVYAVARSPPRCVPGRQSVASFALSCIPKGASDGKIAPSWQDSHSMHPK